MGRKSLVSAIKRLSNGVGRFDFKDNGHHYSVSVLRGKKGSILRFIRVDPKTQTAMGVLDYRGNESELDDSSSMLGRRYVVRGFSGTYKGTEFPINVMAVTTKMTPFDEASRLFFNYEYGGTVPTELWFHAQVIDQISMRDD